MPDLALKNYAGSRISILGGGLSGTSLALLANRLGADVFLSDSGSIAPSFAEKLSDSKIAYEENGHTARLLASDLIVVGSGFPPFAPVLKDIYSRDIPVMGELDFAIPHIRASIIGVTGSNGKTTTTSLIGHLLSSAGKRAAVAGNIGSAVADYACTAEEYDYIAAEFSSFQLHWAKDIELEGAIITNLAPDHIDWHGSFENYVNAKAKILSFTRHKNGFSIFQDIDAGNALTADDRTYLLSWGSAGSGRKITIDSSARAAYIGDRELFSFDDTKLLGSHNMENIAMAMSAVYLLGEDYQAARCRLPAYVAPPHRCALVLAKGGVRYVDDSKGTNIAATVTALSSIDGPKIVILGGKGKGEDYSALLEPLRKFAKHAVLIGEESGRIAEALRACGFDEYSLASGMEDAVRSASSLASPGDVVLLSPACTSWDMYRNYGERGEHFSALVKKIVGGGADDADKRGGSPVDVDDR